MTDEEEGTTVTVTSKGQATIPKKFRDKLHIDAPGRVRFVETEDGNVVIRPVRRPEAVRGSLATDGSEGDKTATERLRDDRERDRRRLDERQGLSTGE